MNIHSENELNPKDGTETPKEVYTNRRKIIAGLGPPLPSVVEVLLDTSGFFQMTQM